ncbi:Calx-beta domain-containing protein [Methylomagnum sp.]
MATPIISVEDAIASEGQGFVDFVVKLNAPSAVGVSVNWLIPGATGPDAVNSVLSQFGTLTFNPGETVKTIRVNTIDNATVDPTAAVALRLLGPTNAVLGRSEGVATLLDNDAATGTPVLSVQGTVVDEAAGLATFTLMLNKPSAAPVTLNWSTQDGTAIAGQDYTAVVNSPLSFAPGELVKTVTVPITNDLDHEGDETFGLVVSSLVGATAPVPNANSTIAANDVALSTIYIEDAASNEHQKYVDFFIRLDVPSVNPITVNYTTQNDFALAGSDYTAQSGTVAFAPGETFKTVRVTLLDNGGVGEFNENFKLILSGATGANLDTRPGNAIIIDDEPFPLATQTFTPTVSVEDGVAAENGHYIDFVVKLNYPLGLGVSPARTVTVNYKTVSGTALGGSDYIAQAETLKFDPDETFKVVRIPLVNDTATEAATEILNLELTKPEGEDVGLDRAVAHGIIVDDDPAQLAAPQLSIQDAAAYEGQGYVDFYVRLDKPSAAPVTVNYATVNGTALAGNAGDYLAQTGSLYFASGETFKAIRVAVVDDAASESTETLQVALSSPANATLARPGATATIVDNDTASGTPGISVNSITVDEGVGEAIFTVSLDRPATGVVTVNYGTADGAAKAGADYISSSGTLSFAPGETAKTVKVVIVNDTETETSESLSLVLSNPSTNSTLGTAIGTATIKQNDGVNDTTVITVDNPFINESEGILLFKVRLNVAQTEPVSFDYSTVGGTATENVDYTKTTGHYEIPAGTTEISISVPITEDTIPENPETFALTLSNIRIAGNVINDLSGTATIRLNDQTGLVAVDDTYTADEDKSLNVKLLANDINPNNDNLKVWGVNGVAMPASGVLSTATSARGTLVIDSNGLGLYTPPTKFFGPDTFTYTIQDSQGRISTATVRITVVTGEPLAVADSATTSEDKPVTITVLANDIDPNKDTLSVTAVSAPGHGTAAIGTDGVVIYTPATQYVGADSFTYTINDGQGHTAVGSVSLTVTSGTPVAVDDSAATSLGKAVDIRVLANDSDPQNDTLSVTALTAPSSGAATIGADGIVTYKPVAGFAGIDSFTYTVSDGQGHTTTGRVQVTVSSGIPSATDDSTTTSQGVPVEIAVLENDGDPENDPLSVISVSVPGHGTAALGKSGVITYTPSSGFYGLDFFTYTISDGQGHTDTAFVDVFVTGVNRAPVLVNPIPDQTGIPTQTFFRYTLSASTFNDPDLGDVLTYSASQVDGSALPSWLVFDPGSHNFLGSPADGDVGSFNVKVTATDRSFVSASDTFTMSVVPRSATTTATTTTAPVPNTQTEPGTQASANHAPTTADHAATLKEGGAYAFTAASFPFADPDAGDALQSVKIVSLPTDGQLKLAGGLVLAGQAVTRADIDSGRLVYEAPALVKDWAQSFTFQVGDGEAVSTQAGVFALSLVPSSRAIRGTSAGESLKGAGKADLVLGQGGNDTLDGKGGGDRLYGEDGRDVLKGGAGNDLLSGGAGDDKLYGQDGKDILAGGAGSDLLDGGAGKDVFLYGAKAFGVGDLSAGDHDIIKATKGDCIAFDSSLWAHLTQNDVALDDLAGHALDGQITGHSNIAYDGHSVMIDLNGDGDFIAGQDLTIEVLGQANKVSVDPTGQFLIIG